MVERTVKIELAQGLAARPAADFVKLASSYTSSVRIGKNNQYVDAKSILGVMSMAFARGEDISLQVDGTDEEQAVEVLIQLLSAKSL